MTFAFGDTPDWVRDAVFYQIFPDRFGRSELVPKPGNLEPWNTPPSVHGYKGGDLLAVAERLDYLGDLGVNALYLTPVFQSASNHRYHTHDYYRVDPMLGGDAALKQLLDRAHERGMRVILDGVFNHASRGFFQFSDILENGRHSAYLDWFNVRSHPLNAYGGGDLGYDAWWNLPALPKFNTKNPVVREYLLTVCEHWLRFGIDGWRLDVPSEIDDDAFWREFRRRCRAVKPDAYSVGEIWHEAKRWLAGDMFDGVMNYPLTRSIIGLVGKQLDRHELGKSGLGHIDDLSVAEFARRVTEQLSHYREEAVMGQLNLLGSHDTPRMMTSLGGDGAAVRLAFLLMFVLPGAPCIYYGDELGMAGGHDPYNRGSMPWDLEEEWDAELLAFVKQLTAMRSERVELRRGSTELRAVADGCLLIAREVGRASNSRSFVLVNVSDRVTQVSADALPSGRYREHLTGQVHDIRAANESATEVPARGALVLLPA